MQSLHPEAVVADKAYAADALIAHIQESGATAVIPPRANRLEQRLFDKHQYKHRNLIERFFLCIKHLAVPRNFGPRPRFRRIATRHDKLAERFSSFIAIVAAFLWLA